MTVTPEIEDVSLTEVGSKAALLVGINSFEDLNITPLNYCVNDIKRMHELLIDGKKGKYDSAKVSLLSDDTQSGIRNRILSKLIDLARKANPEDSILFAFSGHGFERGGIPYIICSDTFTNALETTAIPLIEIKEILESSLARIKIMIIDACHSGVIKGRKNTGLMTETFYNLFFPPPEGFIVITSCQVNEYSYEGDEFKNGVFSHFLLEGVNGPADKDGNKIITTKEAFDYAKEMVMRWAFDKGYKQTPVYEKSLLRDVPFFYSQEVQQPVLYDTSILEMVQYETKWYDLDELNDKIKLLLGQMLQLYPYEEIKKASDMIYTYPDGNIRIIENPDKPERVYMVISMDVKKDNIDVCDNVFFIMNDTFKWDFVRYNVNSKMNFNKLYEKCKQQSFMVISFDPGEKNEIEFDTKGWANSNTLFKIGMENTQITVRSKEGQLADNFHEVVNIRNMLEFIKDLF